MDVKQIFFVSLFYWSANLFAQDINTYSWPTNPGEAILSDKYKVTLQVEGASPKSSEVIMSRSKDVDISDYASVFRGGRTFSWSLFSYDFKKPVKVTVEKLFGTGATDIEIVPSPFKITGSKSADGKSVTFTMTKQQYICVNFKSSDNMHTSDGVVKHMLMIFADPPETDVPSKTAPGVHVVSKLSKKQDFLDADVIYFPKGYHNLKDYFEDVSNMGSSINKNDKKIYFEGGAFVHGRICMNRNKGETNKSGVKIYGRGVLSARDFKWIEAKSRNGAILGVDSYDPLETHINILGSKNILEGIIVCDGPAHGANIGEETRYTHVKLWGWHDNNDGFRPWGNKPNIIENCFLRPCDDVVYNKSLRMSNNVIWMGYNGSLLCLGWDGNYDTENSQLINNYMIYPEWRRLGNNRGLVMSQIDYDMFGINVLIKDLVIDGNIPGLVNLKNNTGKTQAKNFNFPTDHPNRTKIGKVDNIVLENIIVKGRQVSFSSNTFLQNEDIERGLIVGTKLNDGQIYRISNVSFKNVSINGECLTQNNAKQFLQIDTLTTSNILFDNSAQSCIISNVIDTDSELSIYPNPLNGVLNIKGLSRPTVVTLFDFSGKLVYKGIAESILDVSYLKNGLYYLSFEGYKPIKISIIK